MQAQMPEGFLREGEEDLLDTDALAIEFGWIDGYRAVYHRLPHNWGAYSPDLDGVVTTGSTRDEVERNMREAIPLHLAALADDRRERPWLYETQAPTFP